MFQRLASGLRRLSILLIGLGALHAGSAAGATLFISNCNDSGPGSLRQAITLASDGDTIDAKACFGTLPRYGIELTSGPLVIRQDSLTIAGRVNGWGAIGALFRSRAIHHTGTGTLSLRGIALTDGRHTANVATGGCVHSDGHVEMIDSGATSCEAIGQGGANPIALGGGIHARSLTARNSRFYYNVAIGNDSHGGAISTLGRTVLLGGTVSGNSARNGGGVSSLGGATIVGSSFVANIAERDNGGLQVSGGHVSVERSLFYRNEAGRRCGALCAFGGTNSRLVNSTISSNSALYLAAGELTDSATVSNSTIVYNRDRSTTQCVGALRARNLRLESTLAYFNFCNANRAQGMDIGGRPWDGYVVTGSNNLAGRSLVRLPADTINVNPLLEYLLDNGGPTATHRLLCGSPAVDRGNNKANIPYDQRGPGFPRVQGARVDIGAYEQQAE